MARSCMGEPWTLPVATLAAWLENWEACLKTSCEGGMAPLLDRKADKRPSTGWMTHQTTI